MTAPIDREDIALMLSKEIATWTNVTTHKVLERCLRALADRIVDYAHLHYTAGQTTMADVKGWVDEGVTLSVSYADVQKRRGHTAPTSSVLPGLPGSQ